MKNQHTKIIKHLQTAKGLTLRGMGYDIESVRKTHPVTGQRYTRYFLLEE